ncbi:hypothetical protein MA16_Dca028956 [Dendrobium catenatum]|uniref:Uncharacterized protein n=1 Tax=Dendrobium catenatum TaxID=906689 RepID=A0A2I0V7F1_9ASPA|nr:hypothetical protein MA16_Dca028956 [Dendrobium catenatum]
MHILKTQRSAWKLGISVVRLSMTLSALNMAADAKVAELAKKLQETVKRGPYLTKKRIEAKPIGITAERF